MLERASGRCRAAGAHAVQQSNLLHVTWASAHCILMCAGAEGTHRAAAAGSGGAGAHRDRGAVQLPALPERLAASSISHDLKLQHEHVTACTAMQSGRDQAHRVAIGYSTADHSRARPSATAFCASEEWPDCSVLHYRHKLALLGSFSVSMPGDERQPLLDRRASGQQASTGDSLSLDGASCF